MVKLPLPSEGIPACSEVIGLHIASLCHLHVDASVAQGVAALGLAWPIAPGQLSGDGPYLAWRSPRECLFLSVDRETLSAFLKLFVPDLNETALAVDLSDAIVAYELTGPNIDLWLSHLVDTLSIPREVGQASCTRMADIRVTLLRLHPERLWLLADKPIKRYVENWLAYSHEGAFQGASGSTSLHRSHPGPGAPLADLEDLPSGSSSSNHHWQAPSR